MGAIATRRLVDATAGLTAADRALLNLWVHRGLKDDRLAQLTGMTAEAVAARRARIFEGLGRDLGLSEAGVIEALRGLDSGSAPVPEPVAGPAPVAEPEAAAPAPEPEREPAPVPAPETAPGSRPAARADTVRTDPARRRHARLWLTLSVLVAAAVAVLAIVLLSSGGSSRRVTAVAPAPAPASTPSRLDALAALPGGSPGAHGVVQVIGGRATGLKLKLRVSALPPAGSRHHYEAWLYSSVLDSRALGPVRPGQTAVYPLPASARRYRFIDVSLQPRGDRTHSGESRLRADNPAHAAG